MKNETARREIESLDYYLQNHTDDYSEESHTAMMMAIDCLRSSGKTNEWIPVSEKLPEERDWYLGIFKEIDTGWINPLPFICDYVGTKTKSTTEDFWIIRCGSDREDDNGDYYRSLRCVAWMPLPKPYEPQESEG